MYFEFNPFRLLVPPGNAPITSINLQSNLDWFDVPLEVILGPEAVVHINAKSMPALKVFGTTGAVGTPSMISLQQAHIPNIEISQVNGLQGALNTTVKTISSGNATALSVTNNGVGDYLVTPNFGTIANKIAHGNDSRFPATVTGIRKGAGVGSLDTAAIAKTDYWDTTNFIASGASAAKGLVPAPSFTTGTTKYLREDATWTVPPGSGTVTSVGLSAPAEFTVGGSPVVGSGVLSFSKVNQSANAFYAGPTTGIPAPPTFRPQVYADISSLVGTAPSTIAAGNDTRFPASVTGLRKSAGAGSTDVAAVLGTDYWNGNVFQGTGPTHFKGLVPDPGLGGGSPSRFLREDATWQDVSFSSGGAITNAALAAMPANTVKANPTNISASPSDVSAKDARSSKVLNLEAVTTIGDASYTALATDRYISTSVSLSADRTVTLPLANTFNPGQSLTISDDAGGIGTGNLVVARQGADFIQGSSTAMTLSSPYASVMVISDGTSKWSVQRRTPSFVRRVITANTTYNVKTGMKSLFVEMLGGGGGGAGAIAAASNCSGGSGGGSGAYVTLLFTNPSGSSSIVIGTGGAGGVGAGAAGNGGDTSFGAIATAGGGVAGTILASGTAAAFQAGGAGGSPSGGELQIAGSFGGVATRLSGTVGFSGYGAAAPMYSNQTRGRPTEANAVPCTSGYGNGGAGALSLSASSFTGGAGIQGVVIITEYY